MSSSVTRADVSSWQLREVTTNPISSSPRLRSTTAKRPDGEGGSDARTVGRGVGGKEREGREQRDRAYLPERLGEWRDPCQSGLNRAGGGRTRPPEARRIGVNRPL